MLKIDGKNKKVVGIVMECNPFHAGHKRLITNAKKYGDIIVVVMSGNYVQRGEPAVYDKYSRAKKLLSNGVDLVIELPLIYTLSSANLFAYGAVNVLHKLNFVDYLIFGSKIADIIKLNDIANIDIENNIIIKSLLKNGVSYPAALSKFINKKLSGNDILGIEYIRALNKLSSKIVPIAIKRKSDLKTASELRKSINKKISCDSFSDILNYKLLSYSNEKDNNTSHTVFDDIYLMTNDIKNSILNTSNKNMSFSKRAKLLNTKNRTLSNVKRIFLNIIFNLCKSDVDICTNANNKNLFIRLLGVKKASISILKNLKIPYLVGYNNTSYKTFVSKYNKSNVIKSNKKGEYVISPILKKYIFADNLYYLLSNSNKDESENKFLVI